MSDNINQVITLGIGTPGDITHFILVGLSTLPTKGSASLSDAVAHAAAASDAARGSAVGSDS